MNWIQRHTAQGQPPPSPTPPLPPSSAIQRTETLGLLTCRPEDRPPVSPSLFSAPTGLISEIQGNSSYLHTHSLPEYNPLNNNLSSIQPASYSPPHHPFFCSSLHNQYNESSNFIMPLSSEFELPPLPPRFLSVFSSTPLDPNPFGSFHNLSPIIQGNEISYIPRSVMLYNPSNLEFEEPQTFHPTQPAFFSSPSHPNPYDNYSIDNNPAYQAYYPTYPLSCSNNFSLVTQGLSNSEFELPALPPTILPNFFCPPLDPNPFGSFQNLTPVIQGNESSYIQSNFMPSEFELTALPPAILSNFFSPSLGPNPFGSFQNLTPVFQGNESSYIQSNFMPYPSNLRPSLFDPNPYNYNYSIENNFIPNHHFNTLSSFHNVSPINQDYYTQSNSMPYYPTNPLSCSHNFSTVTQGYQNENFFVPNNLLWDLHDPNSVIQGLVPYPSSFESGEEATLQQNQTNVLDSPQWSSNA